MSATLEKALSLIEALSEAKEPCGVTQLGRQLNLNKSTVHRLLDTLCRHGYARQDPATERYMLSTKMWELGVGIIDRLELRTVARPYLEAAAKETGETALLTIRDELAAVIIDKVDSIQPLQIFSQLGARILLHSSSVGKAFLVDFTPEQLDELASTLVKRTERSPATREELLAEVEKTRQKGYAVSVDEWRIGVAGVGAPIRGVGGDIIGSLGITGPTSRLSRKELARLGEKSLAIAGQISTAMGHRG